jgi:hypothetical protein
MLVKAASNANLMTFGQPIYVCQCEASSSTDYDSLSVPTTMAVNHSMLPEGVRKTTFQHINHGGQ